MIEFYKRTSYWLFIIEIPHIRGKELLSAINIKLNSLYPGNISERKIQIRKNGTKKGSYLVFVLDKNTGNEMLPLSPLFAGYLYAQKTANILYVDKNWLDYIRIENGVILSSTVKLRNEDTLLDDFKLLCGEDADLIIYCDKNDKELLTPLQEDNNIQLIDSEAELRKTDPHKISLFIDKSPVIKRRRIITAVAVLFLLLLGSWMLFLHKKNENELNARLRLEQDQIQKEALQKQRENQRLSELKTQYQEIISSKTATPFDIAVVIAECADRQTRIQSATFNANFFQIEGLTGDSLGLLSRFENHRLMSNVRLHQVHPAGNRDTFTLSGAVKIETESIDESLTTSEQIDILEKLIASENYASKEPYLSPSAFGDSVRALFRKWGCTINSYQYMNEPHKTEVEYSLRGTGNGFFNALYEIKTAHRLWNIRLTQIRNLYPRNMLDIVVRIETEYDPSKTENADAVPAVTVNPYPVANISRNYFAPAPVSSISAETAAAAPPPIVAPDIKTERVSWLEYIGSIYEDNESRFVYVKDTRNGEIFKLGQNKEGDMRYAASTSGGIIAYINGHTYEINRR